MKKFISILLSFTVMLSLFTLTSCKDKNLEAPGKSIISAKEGVKLLKEGKVILVDLQTKDEYVKEHIKNAVNIPLEDITQSVPYPNMLASGSKIEEIFSNSGISNDSIVIAYDNVNNMNAARLWWTGMIYGFENIKVISGGLKALKAEKLEITGDIPTVTKGKFTTKEKNENILASLNQVKEQVNNKEGNTILLDTRSEKEFNEGTIPGSILYDYIQNNYNDGTYKNTQSILIGYKEKKITPDKNIIIYCKTSIRGAQTFLALYNAGYRNLKLYDGAYVEWSSIPSLPIQKPENAVAPEAPSKNNNS